MDILVHSDWEDPYSFLPCLMVLGYLKLVLSCGVA